MEEMVQQEKKPVIKPPAMQQLKGKKNRTRCKDLLLHFFSLGLGILIWFLVVGADQMDMNVTIPIEVLNLPKDLVIYNQYKKELNVTMRGPRSIVQEMRSRNIFLPIDLSKAVPDTVVINTDTLSIPLPSGISVVRMQPASITLSIDQLVQKYIPITPEVIGEVAPGHILKELTLNPDKIQVSGPKKLLEQQLTLSTYSINLDGINHSTTVLVHLNLSIDFINLIGETTVAAKIKVGEKFLEKIIHKIPINIRDAERPVTVRPDSISVFASIPESLLIETPVLPMLFRASVHVGDDSKLPSKVPVNVVGVEVPGHEPIIIKSHTPLEVEISPEGKP